MSSRALVFDYDGVLAKFGSETPLPGIIRILEKLKGKYRILVASTRSTEFLVKQVPVADGYIGICGLEILVNGMLIYPLKALDKARSSLLDDLAGALKTSCLRVELKKNMMGWTMGLAISWRRCAGKPVDVISVEEKAVESGLYLFRYQRPFLEIYVAEASKARGVSLVRRLLGLSWVSYFGDSESDIEVFPEVEYPVFVRNEYNQHMSPGNVVEVRQDDLASFLERLI
ncbi:MAG: HAD hydrolase family protein [Thermogladius sp.]|nr:HAD hydrolase family protein [Thermogladius sp.]